MFTLSKLLPAERTAVMYVTAGALTDVWSGMWFFYLRNNVPSGDAAYYWCYGFLLTGLTLLVIGLAVGWLGRIYRSARHPELPRAETPLQAEPPVAANTPVITVLNAPATPAVPPNGRIVSTDMPVYQLPISEKHTL